MTGPRPTGTRPAVCLAPSGPGNGPGQSRSAGGVCCRIPGCPARVGRLRLMCRPHWYQVPKPLRDLIWATWRSGSGIFDPAYRQAVGQAVAAVQATSTSREGGPP